MNRLRRRLFNTFIALYLFLCLATATLWVRSYFVWDQTYVWPNARPFQIPYMWRLNIGSGMCLVSWDPVVGPDHKIPPSWHWLHRTFTPSNRPSMLTDRRGFFYFFIIQGPWPFGANFHIPFRTLCFPLAIPLALWLWRSRKRWRPIPAGHCTNCGYNLTANVSGICPECGLAVQNAVPAK